jgi:hypothetical protein
MTITNTRATFGLNAKATPVKAGTSGTVQIGDNNETINLTATTKIVSFDAVIVGGTSDLIIDVSDLDNTGSTSWTAGTAQEETATAAGPISGRGNATVVVTSAGMTGSPITLSVPVLASDAAAAWAAKVRTALNANAVIAARFTVGGASAAILLTRKPLNTYTINGTSVPCYAATDGTLNISLDNGTCTGITTAASSANTTAGVATDGAYVPDLDGTDFEGEATGGMTAIKTIFIKNSDLSSSGITITQGTVLADYPVAIGDVFQSGGNSGGVPATDITIEPAATGNVSSVVTVTIAGL